jgi:hypothetical protein
MVRVKPGGAVPSVADAAEKSWWVFKYYHPATSEDAHLSYVSGYRRAMTDSISDQLGLGGWDSLTRRLLEVLEELLIERQIVREAVDDGVVEG